MTLIILAIVIHAIQIKRDKNTTLLFLLVFISLLLLLYILKLKNRQQQIILDIDSFYNRIILFKVDKQISNRPVLNLMTDRWGLQAGRFFDKDDDLAFFYTQFYRLADYFNPTLKNALMIGGGAYSYPKDFLQKNRNANLDVVEIDPAMTRIAVKYFNLRPNDRLTIIQEDGRTFLNRTNKKYDAIFFDVFNYSTPFQILTQEVVKKTYEHLTDNGVVIINLVSAVEGKKSLLFKSSYQTYKSVYPQIFVFPLGKNKSQAQNIILVAYKSKTVFQFKDKKAYSRYLKYRLRPDSIKGGIILTDDFAPVDFYTFSLYSDINLVRSLKIFP